MLPFAPQPTFDLVTSIRFLDRTLFDRIFQIVRPGGFFLLVAFSEGCFRPTNPKRILRRGEMASIFGPAQASGSMHAAGAWAAPVPLGLLPWLFPASRSQSSPRCWIRC